MTPDQQRLIDAAAEAYEAALVKGAANPYIPALEAAVTVALKKEAEATQPKFKYPVKVKKTKKKRSKKRRRR